MDDDWCSQTYLQIPRFAWPFLKACILLVVFNCDTCTRCAGWHTILYISLVTKIALLAISTLETWVLWMTLAVASLNCCWMTLNDSTWGGAIKVSLLWFSQGVFSQSLLLLGQYSTDMILTVTKLILRLATWILLTLYCCIHNVSVDSCATCPKRWQWSWLWRFSCGLLLFSPLLCFPLE